MSSLKPRPDCEGPKLEPFTHDITAHDVEFLEIPYFETAHGVIAKVKIDGQIYCLKLFIDSQEFLASNFVSDQVPLDTFPNVEKAHVDHISSFHCECRAFGRLKQLGREKLAVRVYGYISLPLTKDILMKIYNAFAKDEKWLDKCAISYTDGIREAEPLNVRQMLGNACGLDDGSWCIMGIVKDWMGPVDEVRSNHNKGLTLQSQSPMFGSMLANLKALHRCGIVVCDVKLDQWVNGTLVDLSSAMTIPHIYGPEGESHAPSWVFASVAAWDLRCFQTEVVDYWNEFPWSTFYPSITTPPPKMSRIRAYNTNESLCEQGSFGHVPSESLPSEQAKSIRKRLRPRPWQQGPHLPLLNERGLVLDLQELPPYDPAKFNWRAAEVAGQKLAKSGPTMPSLPGPSASGPSARREEDVNKKAGLKRKASWVDK